VPASRTEQPAQFSSPRKGPMRSDAPLRQLQCWRMLQMKMLYLLHSMLRGIQQWIAATWPT
jgi:hypothetical protein